MAQQPGTDRPDQARHTDVPSPQPRAAERAEVPRRVTDPAWVAKVAIALFLLVIFVLFIIQNADPVLVNFVFFRSRIPLIWVFLGCALIGGIVAWLIGRPRRRAMKKLIEELERQRTDRRR